jgi:hypothetical protein
VEGELLSTSAGDHQGAWISIRRERQPELRRATAAAGNIGRNCVDPTELRDSTNATPVDAAQ